MIKGIFNSGSLQAVERLVQFTGERHRVITNNIANLSTPYFRPRDLSTESFQRELTRAIDDRRSKRGSTLELEDTAQLEFRRDHIQATPSPMDDNIMFHDRNNRDVERMMQSLAENTMAHNAGIEMLRNEFAMLETAISERP